MSQQKNIPEIAVFGTGVPPKVKEFRKLKFPDNIIKELEKEFRKPTPIQSQAWPIALEKRDLVGIAQTGSGKTLAYILPAIVQCARRRYETDDGPIALILAPTRELAQQIHKVSLFYSHKMKVRSSCCFGGASKKPQLRDAQGAHIIIATPGRLNDFLSSREISLKGIRFLVLDEADRLLDMGFEPQIRRIITKCKRRRQTLMFSATWPREVENLAEEFLENYIKIKVGSEELCSNHNIQQLVDVVEEAEKDDKLKELLDRILEQKDHKTLVFAETKKRVDELTHYLKELRYPVESIHGNKSQENRNRVLEEFRQGRSPILIATDVASRGLDVDDIKYVINVDFPKCSEDYIHRIGRTARSNNTGTAYTFFTFENMKQAKDLVDILEEANQSVNPELLDLVEMSKSFSYGKGHRWRGSDNRHHPYRY